MDSLATQKFVVHVVYIRIGRQDEENRNWMVCPTRLADFDRWETKSRLYHSHIFPWLLVHLSFGSVRTQYGQLYVRCLSDLIHCFGNRDLIKPIFTDKLTKFLWMIALDACGVSQAKKNLWDVCPESDFALGGP